MKHERPGINPEEGKKASIELTRHGRAAYKTYGEILSSENPKAPFDASRQVTPDLTPAGVEAAKKETEKFFEALDPNEDSLFFVSSNEARAIETANIYREAAHAKGFEVIKPEHARSRMSEDLAGGEIRVVHTLSINPTNLVVDSIFNPPAKRGAINWDAVEPEFKARFDQASKIIEADDQGTFGANLAKHGEEIKKIFPEMETAEEIFRGQFQQLKRLAKFGVKKAQGSAHGKSIKILAFGHENYLLYVIQKMFQEEGINNCETMRIDVEEGKTVGYFRGKKAEL